MKQPKKKKKQFRTAEKFLNFMSSNSKGITSRRSHGLYLEFRPAINHRFIKKFHSKKKNTSNRCVQMFIADNLFQLNKYFFFDALRVSPLVRWGFVFTKKNSQLTEVRGPLGAAIF